MFEQKINLKKIVRTKTYIQNFKIFFYVNKVKNDCEQEEFSST